MPDYAEENAKRYAERLKAADRESKESTKGNKAIEKELRKRGRIIHKEQR